MFKKLIRIKNNIFYSPSHNTFFRLEPSEQVDFSDFLLEISGHEEKIFEFLIYNYNNYVTKETLELEFPECTDPYNKTLDRLRRDKIEGKLKLYGLIKKTNGRAILYLSESPFSSVETISKPDVPLLCRENYYVDYDRILSDCSSESADAPQSILHKWIEECSKLTCYDEKCLRILECIGFLPAFGGKADKLWFLQKAKGLIYRFDETDIREYSGTELLIFARSVLMVVIEYIEAQLEIIIPENDICDLQRVFDKILQTFLTISVPENRSVNPLLLVAYYDYLGLVNYRNFLYKHAQEYLLPAKQATEMALKISQKVDMHLQIWKAFLTYNLGRIYSELNEHEKAIQNIQIAVILRQALAESPFFSDELKRELCFEFLLARIVQTDIQKKAGIISEEDAHTEYCSIKDDTKNEYGQYNNAATQSYKYLYSLLSNRMG